MQTTIKERPILFSGEMVRAILEGRKTQTRRVMKPQPVHKDGGYFWPSHPDWKIGWAAEDSAAAKLPNFKVEPATEWFIENGKCPYGQPRDRLWVRETWAQTVNLNRRTNWPGRPHLKCTDYYEIGACMPCYIYRADGETDWVDDDGSPTDASYWKPSIHMPRWASRILLEITDIRVERMQDITLEGALAEGAPQYTSSTKLHREFIPEDKGCYRAGFREFWDSLNEKRGFGWDANPWVWLIGFKVVNSEDMAKGEAAREKL